MIIARATSDGDELIILGLSAENIRRLVEEGKPIICRRETHGEGIPEGWKISILYGETEESIAADFKEFGLITPDTKIIKSDKLGKEGS